MDERLIAGYIMAIAGFFMILINALSYILPGDLKSPAFTILGLVLIVIGARTAQRSSWIQIQ
jgi:hypothetical protein